MSTAPLRASEISAEVELTPPTASGADVWENVTRANVADIQTLVRSVGVASADMASE